MQYTKLPQIIDDLVSRLSAEANADGYTAIYNSLVALKPTTWYNLPYQLNNLTDIIKAYQLLLIDGDLQDLIDEIGIIYWYNIFKKASLLIESVELIESL